MQNMQKQSLEIDEYDLVASICRESFFDFVKEFWEEVIADTPVWNWHIPYLCGRLQRVAERVFEGKKREKNLVINIPPGTTKSTICSVMYPAWIWTRMPHARIIGASYSLLPVASDLSRKNRDIILSDKYRRCFSSVGRLEKEDSAIDLREDQKTKHYFVNSKGGMRYAVGTQGSVTGMHAHFLIVDDPIDPRGARSDSEIRSTNIWLFETLFNRKTDKDVTPVILIMQRLHVEDATAAMLEKMGDEIEYICLPAELNDDVKPERLKRYYTDGLLDPVRLNRRILENEKRMGQYYYAGQFLQSPIPEQGGMFNVDKLEFQNPDENIKWGKRVRYWDKAATQDDGCFTVGALLGEELLKDGKVRYWVLDIVRGQWNTAMREKIIRKTAEEDGVNIEIWIEQEPGSGGKDSAETTMRNLSGFRVKPDRPTGDKIIRADPFSAQVNAGNVVLKPAVWNKEYIEEMRFFGPNCKYKDQIDASSGAFNRLFKKKIVLGAFGYKKRGT